MGFNVATININGLNDENKQMKFVSMANYHKLDIVMLQEHNIKSIRKLEHVSKYYKIFINYTTCLKGGVAILISKRLLPVSVISQESDVEGRVISLRVRIGEQLLFLLNVYAPSGTGKKKEREDFFEGLCYYLRHNVDNIIFGGDFNSVVNARDVSTGDEKLISKKFAQVSKAVGLKDVTNTNISKEYTYIRGNYASRIDRMYVTKLYSNINVCETVPVSFSDHNMIVTNIEIKSTAIGKGVWKLNVNLLTQDEVKENFLVLWENLKKGKGNFKDIIEWWDDCKIQKKIFFHKDV